MMYRIRSFNLLAASLLVIAMLLNATGAALAGPPDYPGPVAASAPCYSTLREDLGTVLPSGWRGYDEQSACTQAAQNLTAVGLRVADPTSTVDLSTCYRALRQDLGTVFPGHESNFLGSTCSTPVQANTGAK